MSLRPRELQALLIDNGFPCGPSGADGLWGPSTEAAVAAWFRSGRTLVDAAVPDEDPNPPRRNIVPLDWMPACPMQRIIVHWTAGAYQPSDHDRDCYHILVDGQGRLVLGTHSIADNVNCNDGDYAAHTRESNTGSIGISACSMAGAIERPFRPGASPLTRLQWERLAQVAAELCSRYSIPVTPRTVLSHAEVQATLGIPQRNKWDINVLPWDTDLAPAAVHAQFREMVAAHLRRS